MTYWEQRAVDSVGRMEKAVNGQIPDLVKSFEAARNDLNDQIERFFARYAKNNKISLADARQQLSLAELKDFKGNLSDYEDLARRSIGTFNLQVDNLSVKARIPRLEALQMQCDAILQKLYQEQQAQISVVASDIYKKEYYQQLFAIEQYTGFKFEFSNLSDTLVRKVIEQPVFGMDISEHLWRQDIDTGFRIRQTLNNMFVTGKPPRYFAEQLSKVIGAVQVDEKGNVTGSGKKFEAYRLLYNESAHSVNQAQLQAYRDDGIGEYENIETLDRKTCDECQAMDGKHFPVDKAIEGENHPSFHVFCRGTTAPYIPDLANLTGTRVTRDPMRGNKISATADNYDDWIKQKNSRCGKVMADKQCTIAQNENDDFALYQKYKAVLKSDAPQLFTDFQNLKYNGGEGWESLKDQLRTSFISTNSFQSNGLSLNIPHIENIEKISEDEASKIEKYFTWIKLRDKPFSNILGLFAKENSIKIDTEFENPFAYSPKIDKVIINPNHEIYPYYFLYDALSHEFAHRCDLLYFDCSANSNFIGAINSASKQLIQKKAYIIERFNENENISYDFFVGDIISALSSNKIATLAGHPDEYWKKPGNKAKELFANFFVLGLHESDIRLDFIKVEFPELYDAFLRIIEEES